MDIASIAEQERMSKEYAEQFFTEEEEMQGIFDADIKILDRLVKKKGRLLDVAMGPGRHVRHFAAKGFQVWGNDFNAHMVAAARKYVGEGKARLTNHDMRNLDPLKDNHFDYVICMGASLGSIYGSKDRQRAVSEMARVAKKGALVFIHAHNLFEITELEDIVGIAAAVKNHLLHREFEFGDIIYEHGNAFKKAYMHWFTPKELKRLMGKAGLKVEKEFYLKGPDQDSILAPSPLKCFRAGGFVFVGRKAQSV